MSLPLLPARQEDFESEVLALHKGEEPRKELSEKERSSLQAVEARVEKERAGPRPVGALVIETVHSTGKWGLSAAYLRALTALCKRLGVMLVEGAFLL